VAGVESNGEGQRLHPATKTFLALRIAVESRDGGTRAVSFSEPPANNEFGWPLGGIELPLAEDRLVKHAFQEGERAGTLRVA